MNKNLRPIAEINLATLFISTSGILGKLITLPAPLTILIRSVFAVFFLILLMKIFRIHKKVNFKKHLGFFVVSGICLAGHWVFYFYAIQISTVAVAVISLFTYPVITTLLEPLFLKTRLENFNIVSSVVVLIGVFIIIPAFDLDNNITLGILAGILSSVMYSCRNILSKKYIHEYSGIAILLNQLIFAIICLIPFGFVYAVHISTSNLIYLIILGLMTTALGHVLFVRSLQYYSTSTVSIISSLQPVYAVLWAVIIINESLNSKVLIGGSLIFAVVIAQNLNAYKKV